MQSKSDCILLGDDGYGLTPFLMKPYKNPQTAMQKQFNKKHCLARITIEHSFGQLKNRFPSLHYGIRIKLNKVPSVIASAIILHNVAKYLKDGNDFDELPIMPQVAEAHADLHIDLYQRGVRKRERICRILY